MRLKRIFVQGLFDTFDHDLSLNLEGGITLMLGENGMGKTVMLRMLPLHRRLALGYDRPTEGSRYGSLRLTDSLV